MIKFLASAAALLALTSPATGHDDVSRELLFADEFNASELDRTHWKVIGTDFWVNNEQQAYVDDPSVLSIVEGSDGADGGALMLRPRYTPGVDPHPDRQADFFGSGNHVMTSCLSECQTEIIRCHDPVLGVAGIP